MTLELNSELNLNLQATYYYEILVPLKLPNPVLTYSSDQLLDLGTIVTVSVRNKEIKGLVWKVLDNSDNKVSDYFEQNKIQIQIIHSFKYIDNTIIIIPKKNMEFLKLIYLHSFNQLGIILESFLVPYTQLSNRNWFKLENEQINKLNSNTAIENTVTQISNELKISSNEALTTSKKTVEQKVKNNSQFISFEVNQLIEYIKVRIIALIRSNINACLINTNDINSQNQLDFTFNLLQIIPEKKYTLFLTQQNLDWVVISKVLNKELIDIFKKEYRDQSLRINIVANNFDYSGKSSEVQSLISSLIIQNKLRHKEILSDPKELQKEKKEKESILYNQTTYNPNNSINRRNDSNSCLNSLDNKNSLSELEKKPKEIIIAINFNIYTGARSIMFLPFNNIDCIYLFDEGSNYYIQEQNSLYYDARELIYYFAQIHKASLYLISNHQSTRAFQYQKNLFNQINQTQSETQTSKFNNSGEQKENKLIQTMYNLETENNLDLNQTSNSLNNINQEYSDKQSYQMPNNEFIDTLAYSNEQTTQKALRINLVQRNYLNSSINDIYSFEVDQMIKRELKLED